MDSSTEKTQIYVRLLNKGTEVSRPTETLDFGDGRFKILPTERYDPADEICEFLPGSVVRDKRIEKDGETYLLAVSSD